MTQSTPPSTQVPNVNNTGRLKYADPRDLPSYPSTGLRPNGAAAGAAATLGWNNQKPVELWKPNKTSSASAAAVLAKDYKMAPQWEPSPNSDGHKAALLAVGSASSALKHHRSASAPKDIHQGWGNSAATQAFHASRPAVNNQSDLSHGSSAATQAFEANRSQSVRISNNDSPVQIGDRSLLAAKGAMSSNLQRSQSTANHPADRNSRLQSDAATSALNGATRAHRASLAAKPSTDNAGAVPVTTMTRNMFTSNPMVKPEVDEHANNERLHQSAVEMAKKMFSAQQKMLDQAKNAQDEETEKPQPSPYLNLQDAAYKQAQERLSKLHDEHQQNRELQDYYGQGQAPKRRFTVTNRLRRKSSHEEFDDQTESQKIRQQMSMFSSKLSEVDKSKRQQDRDALLAAAQRNVKAQMHSMDQKVYNDTGKVNPSLLSEWEVKAHQAAQARSQGRNENKGKVDLGGGMFMDSDEVDAIAAKRMQPLLDDITAKAEAERERIAALKMAEEARREEAEKQKSRDREVKEIQRRIREEDKQDQKAKRLQEKEDERAKREQEKAEKAEQKRVAKEERRKSKHDSATSGVVVGSPEAAEASEDHAATTALPIQTHESAENHVTEEERGTNVAADSVEMSVADRESPHEPIPTTQSTDIPSTDTAAEAEKDSPTSPKSGVRSWIKNRLSRGKSIGNQEEGGEEEKEKRRKSFFRGNTITKKPHANDSTASLDQRASSMRDVAMAGKTGQDNDQVDADRDAGRARDSRGVSPVSSLEDERSRHRDVDESDMLAVDPPRPIGDLAPRSGISPSRDSRFREEIGQ